jgi:UrcA family protein
MFELLKSVRAAALLTIAATAPVMAAEKPVIVQADISNFRVERVSYAGLDLANARHLKTLNFRVAGAVERVCQRDFGRDGLQDRGYYKCENNAWENARPQIDNAIARASSFAMSGQQTAGALTIAVSAS